MWNELIRSLAPTAVFAEPLSELRLKRAEDAMGHPFPAQLAALLRESNGVAGEHGLGLVWSADRIVEDNMALRTNGQLGALYMPFEPLLFFGDAGNGDQFALRSPPVERGDVFAWDHESDSRTWVAPDVETYLRWWLTGKIRT